MRASSDRLAAHQAGVRASDAERDQAIGELRDRFAEGRLSQDTFLYRIDAALRAKDRNELSGLFADLPRSLRHQDPQQSEPGPGDEPGGPASDTAGRPGLGRRVLTRLTAARRVADRLGAAAIRPRSPQLCLPPEAGKQKFTIGRELACDFTLADLTVSRWHARLCRDDGHWILSDLGSTNGTRLNGWRVTSGVRVRPGDWVSFGDASFVFTDRPASAG
jgi:Domain of unknown function (DUF1707)/FHA domain